MNLELLTTDQLRTRVEKTWIEPVSYTHLRAHETREDRGWRVVG